MIQEIAMIKVDLANAAAFEQALGQAGPIFKAAEGCLGFAVDRSIERPGVYRLVVSWVTLEAHTIVFRGSPGFARWRALVGGLFAEPPNVEHVERVVDGFGCR